MCCSDLDHPMLEMIGCVNVWNDLHKWLWPDDPEASGSEDSDSETVKLFQLLTSCMDFGKILPCNDHCPHSRFKAVFHVLLRSLHDAPRPSI